MLPKTSEYALRVVVYLARGAECDKTPIPASQIAEVTQVPRRYLQRVLRLLVAGRVVESRIGATGGYLLTRDSRQLTILDIVNAVEPVQRFRTCPLRLTTQTALCPLHAELDRAYAAIEASFDSVTFYALLNSTNRILPFVDS